MNHYSKEAIRHIHDIDEAKELIKSALEVLIDLEMGKRNGNAIREAIEKSDSNSDLCNDNVTITKIEYEELIKKSKEHDRMIDEMS